MKLLCSKMWINYKFLIEDDVLWVDSTRELTEKTITGDYPNDFMPYLVKNEVPIGV